MADTLIDGYEELYADSVHGQWRVAFCGLGWRVDYAPMKGVPKPNADLHDTIGIDAAAFITDDQHELHSDYAYSDYVTYHFAGCVVVFIRHGADLMRDAQLATKH